MLNSIQDANGNKIGTIKVEDDTQDVLLSFEESFLQQDEGENKKSMVIFLYMQLRTDN